ncbi:unnamed protein product, partial [marine sediment metagenome]
LGIITVGDRRKHNIKRRWKLRDSSERELLENILVRFHITTEQIGRIIWDKRQQYGIYSTLEKIIENPYILAEEYVGDGPDDVISFNKIDHGIFPSPDIDVLDRFEFEVDDARRLRALSVEQLRRNKPHTFQSIDIIINAINHRLSYLPEWKRHQYNARYFEIDKQIISESVTIRADSEGKKYLYLNANYEAERLIENQLRDLLKRPDIEIKKPITKDVWKNYLKNPVSPILLADPKRYEFILSEQSEICARLFIKPVSIISGGAGTGKTTLIKAIIDAIKTVDGRGASIQLLAPTGKAA